MQKFSSCVVRMDNTYEQQQQQCTCKQHQTSTTAMSAPIVVCAQKHLESISHKFTHRCRGIKFLQAFFFSLHELSNTILMLFTYFCHIFFRFFFVKTKVIDDERHIKCKWCNIIIAWHYQQRINKNVSNQLDMIVSIFQLRQKMVEMKWAYNIDMFICNGFFTLEFD